MYATGITVKNLDEARKRITDSILFENQEVEKAVRIIKSLISQKYITKAQDSEAESRVDYLADMLGLTKNEVVSNVERMRQEGILADSKDISAYINDEGTSEKISRNKLERFLKLEQYILNIIPDDSLRISYKQLNDNAQKEGVETATEKDIRTLLYFLCIKGYTRKKEDAGRNVEITLQSDIQSILRRFEKRRDICIYAIEWLYKNISHIPKEDVKKNGIQFSVVELLNDYKKNNLFASNHEVQLEDIEEALLYLSKIESLKLEGGFLVLYNAMDIRRIKDNKLRYKQEDYRMLSEFYRQKIQQVHIVGEYANLMVRDYHAALQYVQDYFQMDYKRFIAKYFKEERAKEIERNLTPAKYEKIFGALSTRQNNIISDKESRCIVVAAGPGSGKTRVLVHKLASLLLMEDVKHEQLLMLTFSRAAAIEFKTRLMQLIGNAAHFVEIKTFHSYCFDLLGKIGNLDEAKDVVACAAQMIGAGEVEPSRIAKTVLVIDEAQDMSEEEYALIQALMGANEEMRVIAVGDDDQNIYEFRGSDSRFMAHLLKQPNSRLIEMTENYRSSKRVVDFANAFVRGIRNRMKRSPIVSMTKEEGFVSIHQHASSYMYIPLIEDLMVHHAKKSTCILTQTNEEAVILVAMLRKLGLSSKLIQSMDGFRFWNLAEVRMFLKLIDANTHSVIIPDEVWDYAKKRTFALYADSSSLPYLKTCIRLFEETTRAKYLTDFKEFIFESSIEDFCETEGADVVVSTIHKAKGREFDDVYMLIKDTSHNPNRNTTSDQLLRKYYVGATRAKSRLFIHTNSSIFSNMPADEYTISQQTYEMPEEVVLQLSHKDVNLSFFKPRKKEILALRAGQSLRFENNYLFSNTGAAVAQLSQKMQTELISWSDKGYEVTSASIRFIVAWRPKDATKEESEHAVLLIDLTLKKSLTNNGEP